MHKGVLPFGRSIGAALAALMLCSCSVDPNLRGSILDDARSQTGTTTSSVATGAALTASAASSTLSMPPAQSASASARSLDSFPRKVKLDVPFSSQAPESDWSDPYQEACEEMSAIMVHSYLANEPLGVPSAKGSLLALIAWQMREGYPQDVDVSTLARIMHDYYGHRMRIIENPSIDSIKHELAQGRPVIVPAAGRELGNPYFSGEGPWYHMLVITGYDDEDFITNDPGTRRGKDYRYSQQVLMNAIHDWTGVKEETSTGRSAVLVPEESAAQ